MADNIRNHKHIVFGFEHYNPLGIVRSLGEYGIEPIGIIVKDERRITSKSKYLKKIHFVDSIKEGYRLLVSNYGNEQCKPFVYASDDQVTNLMDSRYEELKDQFYFYNGGMNGRIAEFQQKDKLLELAEKHGLNYLKTVVVNKGEIPDDIEYPIITKAIISTFDNWKGDMIICNNADELKKAYKKIKSGKILIQKYIKKKNELCIEGISVDCGRKSVITIASKYNYLLEDSYSPYMTVNNLDNSELRIKIASILEEVGFEGIFEVEFLVDKDDSLYFLEINFRNSTWSYASTIAGMNLPISWAKGMLNPKTSDSVLKRISQPFTAMVEFDDHRNRVKTGKISNVQWFKDFKNAKCKYYWASKDYKPVWSVVFHKVAKILKRG